MTDPHPTSIDHLRAGFEKALARLGAGSAKTVVVLAVDQVGRGITIWEAGERGLPIQDALVRSLYMPTVEPGPVSREASEKPEEDEGYKPKVTVDFDDRVSKPTGNLEQDIAERVYHHQV